MEELKPVFDEANRITSQSMSPERERELFRYLHPIPWIKCSDRMPPDDIKDGVVICWWRRAIDYKDIHTIEYVYSLNQRTLDSLWWIPFDEATWRELNR